MKTSLLKSIVSQGKHPMVKLTDVLWDDSFGQKGMLARVTAVAADSHDLVKVWFDYNENRVHNLNLDEPNWWIGSSRQRGTAIESGFFDNPDNLVEDVLFEENGEIPVELVEEDSLLGSYIASGSSLSYVEWLEEMNTVLRLEKRQKDMVIDDLKKNLSRVVPLSEDECD